MSKWKFKDPNKKSNYHKFEKIVRRDQLANARQEAFNKFKREVTILNLLINEIKNITK